MTPVTRPNNKPAKSRGLTFTRINDLESIVETAPAYRPSADRS